MPLEHNHVEVHELVDVTPILRCGFFREVRFQPK